MFGGVKLKQTLVAATAVSLATAQQLSAATTGTAGQTDWMQMAGTGGMLGASTILLRALYRGDFQAAHVYATVTGTVFGAVAGFAVGVG